MIEKKNDNVVLINNNYNNILEEYKKKYKPNELTDDGIPKIEVQLREIEEDEDKRKSMLNDEQKYRREMLQRVKCISLHIMGKNIMTDTTSLKPNDRNKLQSIMWSYNDVSHEKIIKEFNEIVSESLFDDDIDYSKLPVYNI